MAQNLEAHPGLPCTLGLLTELLEVERVRLLKDVLQVLLEGHGSLSPIVKQRDSLLAAAVAQELGDLLGLADPDLVPVLVGPLEGLHGLLRLLLRHVPEEHNHSALLEQVEALGRAARHRVPELHFLDQRGDEVGLLAHGGGLLEGARARSQGDGPGRRRTAGQKRTAPGEAGRSAVDGGRY